MAISPRIASAFFLACLASAASTQTPAPAADQPVPPPPPQVNLPHRAPLNPALPTIFVVGDSTASNGPDLGWGSHFGNYFDLTKVNVAWKRILGYELSELAGRSLYKLVDDLDRSRVMRLLNPRLIATDPAPIEIALRHKDRTWRTFLWQRRQRAGEDTLYVTGKDITEKKMMETTGKLLMHEMQAQARKIRQQEESAEPPPRKPR